MRKQSDDTVYLTTWAPICLPAHPAAPKPGQQPGK
ncbi:hypothetical protein W822_13020 [Advenella kashmirensis W13003]|uniref:Uncharacterized protein n=1 Tax=Advenella kashmirensis W13003 TaxID=1424334 RepID=V8QSP9_9BURK|nr:hypothetical protein W822_13020 [Advenella kashmirensis W13003]